MTDYGVNTRKVILAGLLGAILTVAAVMALQVLYYVYLSDARSTGPPAAGDAVKFSQPSAKLQKLLEDQENRLVEYRPADRDHDEAEKDQRGVAIPIDRAMELVVAELSQPKAEEDRDEQ